MQLTRSDLDGLNRIYRLNLINSITGIKPANLIGTRSSDGKENLAIFSSIVHLGSNPPLIGFISRPVGEVDRHTIENIEKTGIYTINHVPSGLQAQAHYTSAKFEREQSEFDFCGFTPEYNQDFEAPFVKESVIKIGVQLRDQIPIPLNGTILFVGEIQQILVPDEVVSDEGYVNLDKAGSAGISGLNSYYDLSFQSTFPYARVKELPEWGE